MIPIKNKKDLERIIDEVRKTTCSYLEKYNPSKQQLRIYLLKKFLKNYKYMREKTELLHLIDVTIEDFESKKFLNDKFYSDSKTRTYFKRGYSLNKIRYSLIKKGIDKKYIQGSISKIKNEESDPDFFSAIKMCKRKRIGPMREEGNRPLFYKKDIGILARAGFSYEISKKILDISKEEYKQFCKLI